MPDLSFSAVTTTELVPGGLLIGVPVRTFPPPGGFLKRTGRDGSTPGPGSLTATNSLLFLVTLSAASNFLCKASSSSFVSL